MPTKKDEGENFVQPMLNGVDKPRQTRTERRCETISLSTAFLPPPSRSSCAARERRRERAGARCTAPDSNSTPVCAATSQAFLCVATSMREVLRASRDPPPSLQDHSPKKRVYDPQGWSRYQLCRHQAYCKWVACAASRRRYATTEATLE
jgi:hypothetical protein